MGFLIPNTPKLPEPIKPPSEASPEVQEARLRERRLTRLRRGRRATLLTGGQGLTGAVPVQGKTLLGS
jgi:hypothetical protein